MELTMLGLQGLSTAAFYFLDRTLAHGSFANTTSSCRQSLLMPSSISIRRKIITKFMKKSSECETWSRSPSS